MEEKEKVVCPFCKSEKVREYVYGLLAFHSEEEREEFNKKFVGGGCEISPANPQHHCDACGKDF